LEISFDVHQKTMLPCRNVMFRQGGYTFIKDCAYLISLNSQPSALAPSTAASESFSSDIISFALPL
jgi:dihydrodipicolinate synthase/N-acetylneuraminate lyase